MAGIEFAHRSVMPEEVLNFLHPVSGGLYLDGTLGGGGHARLILEASSPGGRLVGLDRDPEALAESSRVLRVFGERAHLALANFSEAAAVVSEIAPEGLDGALLDLGVSSYQLDAPERGFSFRADGPLDMRMGPDALRSAADIVNGSEADELEKIFREYGEERWARRIARRIVAVRKEGAILTTRRLADLVSETVPGGKVPARIHPATRVFQALRIAVNRELEHVENGLSAIVDLLKPDGVFVVISFHSLEDRIVKRFFLRESKECLCPPRLPVCVCGHKPRLSLLTRKGVRPSEEEVELNARSRSAVLRAARRCA